MRYIVFNTIELFNNWHAVMTSTLIVDSYGEPILHPEDSRVICLLKSGDIITAAKLRSENWAKLNGFFGDDPEVLEGLDTSRAYAIYKYIDFTNWEETYIFPGNINFNTDIDVKLRVNRVFLRGELQEEVYYEKSALNTATGEIGSFEIPVIREANTWMRDTMGFCYNRKKVFSWFFLNGNEDIVNVISTDKPYNNTMSISEGKRRRGYIVDALQKPMLGMLLGTIAMEAEEDVGSFSTRVINLGRGFLLDNKNMFDGFVNESSREILSDLKGCSDFWLNNYIDADGTTIRDYILNAFNIWDVDLTTI